MSCFYGPAPSHSTCELPVVPGGPEQEVPDPTDSGYLRQSFPSLAVPVFPGLPGGGSVWRAAQMIRHTQQAPPWHTWSKVKWSAWRGVWVWDPSAKGMPLGLGAATAPLDGTDCAPIPLCGKGRGAHILTHTPAHRERAAPTSTCHSRHALTSGARTSGVVLCVGM